MVERVESMDLVSEAYGGGFVGGEEGVVFLFIEEVALEGDEVGGEEDVGSEGGEEGV